MAPGAKSKKQPEPADDCGEALMGTQSVSNVSHQQRVGEALDRVLGDEEGFPDIVNALPLSIMDDGGSQV